MIEKRFIKGFKVEGSHYHRRSMAYQEGAFKSLLKLFREQGISLGFKDIVYEGDTQNGVFTINYTDSISTTVRFDTRSSDCSAVLVNGSLVVTLWSRDVLRMQGILSDLIKPCYRFRLDGNLRKMVLTGQSIHAFFGEMEFEFVHSAFVTVV